MAAQRVAYARPELARSTVAKAAAGPAEFMAKVDETMRALSQHFSRRACFSRRTNRRGPFGPRPPPWRGEADIGAAAPSQARWLVAPNLPQGDAS